VFQDLILVATRDNATLLFRMDTASVVASPRHELGVGDLAIAPSLSFSLFWNKGKGKVEQLVFFAATKAACQFAMSRIQACSLLRLNSYRSKTAFVLARERRPFQGWSNEFGAEYHFAVWCFGEKSVTRRDADTGLIVSKYKARELVKFSSLPSDQNEQRLRVVFTSETIDIAGFGIGSCAPLLAAIVRYRDETHLQMRSRVWSFSVVSFVFLLVFFEDASAICVSVFDVS
jgi:hypothetical protein